MKPALRWGPKIAVAACALALIGCAGENDERDSLGSRLYQPPAGTKRPPPVEAGDIAIVGQNVAQQILQLPQVAGASVPPVVRFNGVTSIINPPIDTEPYTELLRDRLLLLTREKLRFVEHTLPMLHAKRSERSNVGGEAEYQILAEMRGQAKADTYKVQVEFVQISSGAILFNQTYRIAKEAESQPSADQYTPPMAPPSQQQAPPPRRSDAGETGEPSAPPPGYYDVPATNNGSSGGHGDVL